MKKRTSLLALLLAALLLLGLEPVPIAYAVDSPDSIPAEDTDSPNAEEVAAVAVAEEPEIAETQTYILTHADREYVGDGEELVPMDFISVAYTLADADAFDHPPTLDELWLTDTDGDHVSDYAADVLGQFESNALLYSLDQDAAYYVGRIHDGFSDAELADWRVGSSDAGLGADYKGQVVYDPETGLVYVPKSFTALDAEDFGDAVGQVRLQLLYVAVVNSLVDLKTPVTVNVTDATEYVDAAEAEARSLSESFRMDVLTMAESVEIPLPDHISVLSVSAAGIPLAETGYSYDSESGVLTVYMGPVPAGTVDVTIKRSEAGGEPGIAPLALNDYGNVAIDRDKMESRLDGLDSLGTWGFEDVPQEGDVYIIKSGTVAGYYSGGTGKKNHDGYMRPAWDAYNINPDADPNGSIAHPQPEDIAQFLLRYTYMDKAGEYAYRKWIGFNRSNADAIERYVRFSAQDSGIVQDSPDGREITSIPAVNLDLICTHVSIPNTYDDIQYYTGSTGGKYNKTGDVIVDEPIMMRVLYVSKDSTRAVVIVCTATVNTQAGTGHFLVEIETGPSKYPLSLQKVSASPAVTGGNGCYSLAGAVYGLYSDPGCSSLLERLTTDSGGKATTAGLYTPGVYYIKEISPSPGYLLDPTVYTVRIDDAGNVTCA